MISALFQLAKRIDEALRVRLGPAYNAILGIGLVAEIVRRVHELGDHLDAGMVRPILALALFVVLLLHQVAELGAHMQRRRSASHRGPA